MSVPAKHLFRCVVSARPSTIQGQGRRQLTTAFERSYSSISVVHSPPSERRSAMRLFRATLIDCIFGDRAAFRNTVRNFKKYFKFLFSLFDFTVLTHRSEQQSRHEARFENRCGYCHIFSTCSALSCEVPCAVLPGESLTWKSCRLATAVRSERLGFRLRRGNSHKQQCRDSDGAEKVCFATAF